MLKTNLFFGNDGEIYDTLLGTSIKILHHLKPFWRSNNIH